MRVSDFVKFIEKREQYRVWREGGHKPRTPDPIIEQYRFCNVRRNDDRVTKWIHLNYLYRWKDDPELWFALVVARLFNNPDTLLGIAAYTLPFKPEKMQNALHSWKGQGLKIFNAAYIVSTNGRAMDKIDYVIDVVLRPMWANRKELSAKINNVGQLANVHILLEQQLGLGSFMAAQVVADLKYAHPARWEDFNTFAASGPGSKRGLNYILGREPDTPMTEKFFRETLATVRDAVNARLKMEPLTAHDTQNSACEFSKHERFRLTGQPPKQKYQRKEEA